MAAVRSVLLSDIQCVLSLARQRHGYLLTSTTTQRVNQESPHAVFQSFSSLRGRLLRCDIMAELSPVDVIRPFLAVIRHEDAGSSVTGVALQAVLNILNMWPWGDVKDQNATVDAVSDIVDAVSHCRFQETGIQSDQNVLVLIVLVLHGVMLSPCGVRLSDHSMWQLVESLYALSCSDRHDAHVTVLLRSTATTFLHDTMTFIFSNPAIYSDTISAATESHVRQGFGLPCAVKVAGFLCQKLHQRNFAASATSEISTTSNKTATNQRKVLLSLTLLQRALIACDAELLKQKPSLLLFIKDDLCCAILRYCRLGACAEPKITVACLGLIRLLWSKFRSELKMQVETLINGVFFHTLHWCVANMDVSHPDFPLGDDTSRLAPDTLDHIDDKSVTMVDAAHEEFSGMMLSKQQLYSISFEILDCLNDLLAEATLLPDLYVNYDCDGNRCDLTQTLFELLSQAVQQSHIACFESHDEDHFLWAQAIGETTLRGMFNALYIVHLRTQPKLSSGSRNSCLDHSDNRMREDSLLVDQDDHVLHTDADEFALAEELFRNRQRKKFFQHGIQEFNRKPLAGVKYLQQNTFLPTPLDSVSLATFLRSLPQGLNKNAVGNYLGAMGKEVKGFEKTDIHEADTMDFHRDVLTNFVRSFNFEGESIVTALRMFLASFRLPGEAQQIDRILNTFSIQVYEQCRERFLMASADVAYLLSFSLIMLNTDLHNINIRADKKMKLTEFIKNNKNYGPEVSKGRDLPEDFLTELYNAILKDEIKTVEDCGKHGGVTSDRWKDLLNQAESDPRNSRLIVHHLSLHLRSSSITCDCETQSSNAVESYKESTKCAPCPTSGAPFLRRSSKWIQQDDFDGPIPLNASSGNQYDRHILELIQSSLVLAFSSVFHQFVLDSQAKDASRGDDLGVGSSYEVRYLPQKTALQLACNGFVICAAVASHLSLVEHCNTIFIRLCKYSALLSSDVYPVGYNGRKNGISVYCDNESASLATAGVLKLVSSYSLTLLSHSWKYFFHLVSGLRELRALPSQILYSSKDMNLELLNNDERLDFINMVYKNKAELERKIELRAYEQDMNENNTGSFFRGVAWLLTALDSNLGRSTPESMTTTRYSSLTEFEHYQRSPTELALLAEDLIIEGEAPTTVPSGDDIKIGTDQWIRHTLQPCRVEFILQDVASLPSRALVEVIKALHEEIMSVLRGSDEHEPSKDTKLVLSQGGCVFFEHLLSQCISLSGSLFAGEEDGISAVLEAHYTQLLEHLRPVLLTNQCPSNLSYENACFLLYKAMNGLFAWVTHTRSDVHGLLLVTFLSSLMELSGDDELIGPFLAPIMCGLDRYVAVMRPKNLHYSRVNWLTICNLISWSIKRSYAANHGFQLLERLVIEKIWNGDGNEILISDCYLKMMMFAMKYRGLHDLYAPSRPIELLLFMFDTLRTDVPNYVEERLRFLGGMAIVSRQLLLKQMKGELSNELVVLVIEGFKHMLCAHAGTDQSFMAGAWLDILRYGLNPIGLGLLYEPKYEDSDGQIPFGDNEEETNSSFLYYRRQLPSIDDEKYSKQMHAHSDTKRVSGRRRRPSVRDPLTLRPHVVVAQMLSLVFCEEFTKLQTCAKFASVWKDMADLLVGLLEYTAMKSPTPAGQRATSGEVLSAALERRSVLSAHEEILEHIKGIVRRLIVIQDKEVNEMAGAAAKIVQSKMLLQVLVDKCHSNRYLVEQLFSHKEDDAGSIVGCDTSIKKVDSEDFEAKTTIMLETAISKR
ncbi:putative Sec7 domain, guanine nucleotide exchange factor, Sec7 domain superfamily [Plasmopara halstedii]